MFTKQGCKPSTVHLPMDNENRFNLATEPAIKGTITIVSCVSIAYIATHAKKWYGTSCAFLIGIIGIIIGTYQTPSLPVPSK
jgi:hypothetical protein